MTIVSKGIREAVMILKKGGIVAYPTESSYALGCDVTNHEAMRKVYKLKKRPMSKGLTFIVGSTKTAEKYSILGRSEKNVMKKLMPGRLTLVARGRKGGEFAFRIPSNYRALEMAKAFGKPITATSANMSGKEPIFSVKKLLNLWNGRIDMILDGGTLARRRPSTVVDIFSGVNIRRKGPVTKKQIGDALS